MSKRTFQPSKKREETNTVLEKEWLPLMEEKSLHVEELKEEKNYLCHLKSDIRNNVYYH